MKSFMIAASLAVCVAVAPMALAGASTKASAPPGGSFACPTSAQVGSAFGGVAFTETKATSPCAYSGPNSDPTVNVTDSTGNKTASWDKVAQGSALSRVALAAGEDAYSGD